MTSVSKGFATLVEGFSTLGLRRALPKTGPSLAARPVSTQVRSLPRRLPNPTSISNIGFPPTLPNAPLTLVRNNFQVGGLSPFTRIQTQSFFTRAYALKAKKSSEKGEGSEKNSKQSNSKGENGSKSEGNNGNKGENGNNGNGKNDNGNNSNNGKGNNGGNNGNSGKGSNSNNGDDGKGKNAFEAIRKVIDIAENTLQKPSIPENYPQVLALPITRRPLFPGFYKAVSIKDPNVTNAIRELMKRNQPYVGAFLLKDDNKDVDIVNDISEIHKIGVFAQITSIYPTNGQDGDSLTAVLYPHRRIRVTELIPPKPVDGNAAPAVAAVVDEESEKNSDEQPEAGAKSDALGDKDENGDFYATAFLRDHAVSLANVDTLHDEPYNKNNQVVRAITSEIVAVFQELATLNPLFRDHIVNFSMSQNPGNLFDDPAKISDFAAAVSGGESDELQSVLECLTVEERLQKSLEVLKKELINAQLQNKISKEVDSKIAKRQREYYLMEQLKGIKKELGMDSDGKDKLVEKFKERASKLAMPEAVTKVVEEELNKLAHLEPAASEFNVTRNYLDWLTLIPWGLRTRENYNIENAMKVLDEDHYGLKDVKERILEFIAVGKLRGTVEGKIICLAGPPGVGKTSIGKSIARALNREFYRFSVGGLTDVAEIKGHRRTYVGAMPGKVIQALKKVQTENPLILIDEVDKIGRGHQGDPSSALLELLDPEQNSSFLDHYMDIPVDLSRVLFVCTANVLDTIPGPLLDRMEVIQLSGYVADEKVAIAEKYLAPNAKETSGLSDAQVDLDPRCIEALIRSYCRESGVRNLKKHIEKIYRKAALKIVKEIDEKHPELQSTPEDDKAEAEEGDKSLTKEKRKPMNVPADIKVEIKPENLKDFVGPAVFTSDRLYDNTPPGVVMGLAWTSMGGSSLYIESVVDSALTDESKPHFARTGQLGDVMKESSSIAYTYTKSLVARRFEANKFFDKASIHLHVPEGATPKDGPSAGVTMATALLSLALNKPVLPTVAMTGELTLTGKVLKIGGLKEKTIAAKRSGVTRIIFPKANLPDWEELPENIREGIEGYPVEWYEEIPTLVGLVSEEEWTGTKYQRPTVGR
ncbi:ATP-dependent protease La [Basidiobolus meristosporus CBS 931.73]|uniref:Lon protease homolog, mitochondrial n=1 Tax=Basidiobolus meristosporus CBS 931.73 TaxID=1314790 RepID=A0A1Y1X1V6_9FUNG|nr:ATP-dependent protease La [Basidiobolus meristosporus CBS 931.73]|eukprot:ORX79314.1 ATP-dependent protease La [Basidiobolus meristosporus CBS 931.73]